MGIEYLLLVEICAMTVYGYIIMDDNSFLLLRMEEQDLSCFHNLEARLWKQCLTI